MFREGFEEFICITLDNITLGENAIPLFSAKLKKLKLAIKEWLSPRRIDHQARLLEIENLVQRFDLLAETGALSQDNLIRKHTLRAEHFNILQELEVYWKQRSRIQ